MQISAPAAAFDDWLTLRDKGVVRQRYDFSCGLAALATLLTYDFDERTDEQELLADLSDGTSDTLSRAREGGVSFADLAALAHRRGYRASGYHVSKGQLQVLQHPVIVHLTVAGRAHFSVLRGLSAEGHANLADPSWGNRRLASWEFEKLFQVAGPHVPGRVLVIAPMGQDPKDAASPHKPMQIVEDRALRLAPALP